MFLYAQREEDALKLGAKIRIFIGSAKKMDKKSIESQKKHGILQCIYVGWGAFRYNGMT